MTEIDKTRRTWLRRRWRPILACAVVAAIVGLVLMNLVFDALVSRYERTAERAPDSPFLAGMAPRELGPQDAKNAVLFVHGFIGAQSNFNDLPERAAELGWFVRAMRLPGHGTSPRDLERTTASELVSGVLDEVRNLKDSHANVVVVGHSLGGALATLAAAREPVGGLVLCAPYFELTWGRILGIPTARIAQSLAPILRWTPARPGGGPVNLEANREFVDYYGWIPSQGMLAALEVGRRARSPEVRAAISAPLLMIHSKIDSVTSQAATEQMAPGFGSKEKELIWLEASDHVIFWDYESEQVASEVLAFLKEVEIP